MMLGEQIRRRIYEGMVVGYLDLERQLHHHGLDLTLSWVDQPVTGGGYEGWLAADGETAGAPHEPILFEKDGWVFLAQGCYTVAFNEMLTLPATMVARGYAHPSLARCGVEVVPMLWAGDYRGRAQTLLVVHHRSGFRIQRNAPLMQVEFDYLPAPTSATTSRRFSREPVTLGAG